MKIEMHCHTGGTSDCATVSVDRIADIHAIAGYNAVFITNHLSAGTKKSLGVTDDKSVIDKLVDAYKTVRFKGEAAGLKVWLGMEVALTVSGFTTDVLLYGIDERFCYDHPKMYTYSPRQLSDAVRDIGGMMYQAHPFRTFPPPNLIPPKDLDGIESYNGNPNHFCNYLLAREYAITNKLRQLSGSDYHDLGAENRGGIEVPGTMNSPLALINYLKYNAPRLLFAAGGKNAFPAGNKMNITT